VTHCQTFSLALLLSKKLEVPALKFKISSVVLFILLWMPALQHPLYASPTVSLPDTFDVLPGTRIEIPITLSGISGISIGGYFLRLDYDDQVLSAPSLITQGTLSENLTLEQRLFPSGENGKFLFGIPFGFSMNQDSGVLIIIEFGISNDFAGTSPIEFVSIGKGTVLLSSAFDVIDTTYINGNITAIQAEPAPSPTPEPDPPPTVFISTSASNDPHISPIPLQIDFSEPVTGFDQYDILVGNGIISGFSGSGSAYECSIIPIQQGMVTIEIPANAATDAGNNGNPASIRFSRYYEPLPPVFQL